MRSFKAVGNEVNCGFSASSNQYVTGDKKMKLKQLTVLAVLFAALLLALPFTAGAQSIVGKLTF